MECGNTRNDTANRGTEWYQHAARRIICLWVAGCCNAPRLPRAKLRGVVRLCAKIMNLNCSPLKLINGEKPIDKLNNIRNNVVINYSFSLLHCSAVPPEAPRMNEQIKREESVYGKRWKAVHGGGYFSDPAVAAPLVQKVQEFAGKSNSNVIVNLDGGIGSVLSQFPADGLERGVSLVDLDDSAIQLGANHDIFIYV